MRVLQLGRFWNEAHGGVERVVHLLSKGLAEQRVDVVNLVAAPNLRSSQQQQDGYQLVQAASFGLLMRTAISPALIAKAIQLHHQKPFDILHLHFPDPLSHVLSMCMPTSLKRVITWHSDIVSQQKTLRLYQPFLSRICRQADALIAATPAHFEASQQIPADIPSTRKHVIGYGLDFSALTHTSQTLLQRDTLRQQIDKPIIFAMGRHVYYKGFETLLEAMCNVQAHLILGGEGPLTPALHSQINALGIAHKVSMPGRIPEAQLPAYFDACDVFCLPSVEPSEAFGLVQVEAMAFKKPIVNCQLHNGVNIVSPDGLTGLTVPTRNADALAQALNQLIENPDLRHQMGQAGFERAHSQYSIQAMAKAHLDLYSTLLESHQ